MAEKRKLLAEIEKCFKKIDDGVELFESTMNKMNEANSDNQKDKYQEDLKKEIKKLQRLRDQVKGWQNSSDIKDKDKLNQYRKTIEQRMEQFKDIERENKTKPHSKQGLCAEEKLDPRERERVEAIDWVQVQIRKLSDESDRTETQIEMLSSVDNGKRRGKKDDAKKGEKEKKLEELRKHLEKMTFHIEKLEIVMRMVNNESLDAKDMLEKLKEPMETYLEFLENDADSRDEEEFNSWDPGYIYDDLNLGHLCAQIGATHIGSLEDDRENGVSHDNGSPHESEESKSSRHGSTDTAVPIPTPASPAPRRIAPPLLASTPVKSRESTDTAPSATATPPPAPPGIPYNSVAAGRVAPTASASTTATPTTCSSGKASFPIPSVARQPTSQAQPPSTPPVSSTPTAIPTTTTNDENKNPAVEVKLMATSKTLMNGPSAPEPKNEAPAAPVAENNGESNSKSSDVLRTAIASAPSSDVMTEEAIRALRPSQPVSTDPQRAHIPAWLGASPLGRCSMTGENENQLAALDAVLCKTPLPMESERPRTYMPKVPCPSQPYYPQATPPNGDSLEYYLRLSPETLFFIFYYMEGTKAQLLAAKALKKLSWRFHTKYLTWFQRHEEPKQITDDYEQGTYIYFDFEKWSQRKKEQFTFEYRYLEDKDFD